MNDNLLKAILAMDAYNRGYNPAIVLEGVAIGNATVIDDSESLAAQFAPTSLSALHH